MPHEFWPTAIGKKISFDFKGSANFSFCEIQNGAYF
jgi:hypothetical protein